MNAHHLLTKCFRGAFLLATAVWFTPAVVHADFVGPYAPGNWTLENLPVLTATGSGTVTPSTLTVVGSQGPSGVLNTRTTEYVMADATGTVTFNWTYSSADLRLLQDQAWFYLNGALTPITGNGGVASGSGTFLVAAGQSFGFTVTSTDNTGGAGTFTISNFAGPLAAVPEASTYLTFGFVSLLVGGFLARSRKKATART